MTKITNIRREWVENSAAILFKCGDVETCEWLDDEYHNYLEGVDIHLASFRTILDVDDVHDQLQEWLDQNPIRLKWTDSSGVESDSLYSDTTYNTYNEAEEEIEKFQAKLIKKCKTEADVERIKKGKISVDW